MKVQAVISLKAEYPLSVLLDVAGLARSTFFYHQALLKAPDPEPRSFTVAMRCRRVGDRVGDGRTSSRVASGRVRRRCRR